MDASIRPGSTTTCSLEHSSIRTKSNINTIRIKKFKFNTKQNYNNQNNASNNI